MLHRERVIPPPGVYPADQWNLIETKFSPKFAEMSETIFALSNGYLGMRGCFEEGAPVVNDGTYINGFYEEWPIVYGEEAYGYAQTGQTIVNVTDSRIIKLYVDDEPFYLPRAHLLKFDRRLNMKTGTLDREILWETPAGKHVLIKSRRLVSLRSAKAFVMKLRLAISPSVRANSNRWKLNSSAIPIRRQTGIAIGAIAVCDGIANWVSPKSD